MLTIDAPVDADLLRLRGEFLSMPGLCLTVPQVARMLSIRDERARSLLDALVREGMLIATVSGTYRRVPLRTSFIPPVT